MGTHAVLAVKLPDESISGCYVHFDGATMLGRIQNYLLEHTTTDLALLITQAQSSGGMRCFHSPGLDEKAPKTEFLDDNESYVITNVHRSEHHMGANYRYVVDYKTKKITSFRV